MEYFKLYACCIPVKGYAQTALCDIHRNKYYLFSNDLFSFIEEAKRCPINTLKAKYGKNYFEIIAPLFSLLVGQNIGFYTDTPELFPDMDDIWEQPNIITNAVIDVDCPYDISDIVKQLDALGCEALQIRFLSCISVSDIKNMIQAFGYSRLRSIEAYIKSNDELIQDDYKEMLSFDGRLFDIVVYGSAENRTITEGGARLVFSTIPDISANGICGQIGKEYFRVNNRLFFESHHYNSCLNRKLYISSNGEIRNCPYAQETFGNVNKVRIIDVVKQTSFSKLWKINKDCIDVCKDCEFRYICTDCRCIIKDPENACSQPAKCKYNPYVGKWEGEEGYVPVEECGVYTQTTGFTPNAEKIKGSIKKKFYD